MKSYLKFLSRNKLYTAIEAVGLAVSLAFVILIGSYVVQQNEVAHESPEWKRTFVLGSDDFLGLTYWDKEEVEMNIPEVMAVTHMALLWQPTIQIGEELVRGTGMEADAEFFEVFPQYQIIEGNVQDFVGKTDVLISQSLARRLAINGESLVGSILKVNESERTIKGVYADFENSFFLPCDVITHISDTWAANQSKAFNSIGNYATWFRVRPDADLTAVEAKAKALLHKNYDETWQAERVDKWRPYRMDEAFFFEGSPTGLFRSGNKQMLNLLTVVVLLLLLSAIFNYVNLNLALTGKRAKEMATRRLMGADRNTILWKYIVESVAFTAMCFIVALVLAYLLAPMMSTLVSSGDAELPSYELGNMGVGISFMMTPGYIVAYVATILVLGIICGLLPAYVASRYQPIDVIKGSFRRKTKMVLSRVFIVVQNVLAVFLIAIALVMEMQMQHMLSRPTHAAVDNLYYIEYASRDYDMAKLFLDKVRALPFVTKVGMGRGIPGLINMTVGVKVDEEHHVDMPVILCDSTYFQLLGLEVEEDFDHPLVHSLWMSESAFRAAGVSDTTTVFPRRISVNGAQPEFIGGIVHDFPTSAASSKEINPNGGIIVTKAEELSYANCLLIGTTGEDKSYDEAIRKAYRDYRLEQSGTEETAWLSGFMRDLNYQQLEPEQRTLRLVELFAVLSVLIALLGLLAMSTYFADENTKQIAIRKVFGSDVSRETWRNVKSYMILTAIACLIGIPLAVWASQLYLERFAYRIEGYGWIFVVAILILVAIAFGTVLWQTLKAARTNPATELKKE
jgi:ABC-type antimicrobial peptide transport system permease subunit